MANPIASPERLPEDVEFRKNFDKLANWFRLLQEAGLTFGHLQADIDDPDRRQRHVSYVALGCPPISDVLTDAERMALGILGTGKVLGFRNVICAWNAELPETEPAMLFPEDVLRECAEANAQGADWRLAYIQGLSLRQQQEIRGWNRKKQPCFDPDVKWWLESQQDSWATRMVESGYRLYDFAKTFPGLHWQTQSEEIAKLVNMERAEEQAVAEICFSNFLLNNGDRLLSGWYHWGHLQTSGGSLVYAGLFDRRGFVVYDRWGDFPLGLLAVVLSRKAA